MILIKQMRNQRRRNFWLFLELVIISCLMWYTIDSLYSSYFVFSEPLGIDTDDVYHVEVHYIMREDSAGNLTSSKKESSMKILEGIKKIDGVESACATYLSMPFQGYNLNAAYRVGEHVSMYYSRTVTPDYMRVFRVGEANGYSNDSLVKTLEADKLIISDHWQAETMKGDSCVGKQMWPCANPYWSREVGACLSTRVKANRWATYDYDHVYHCLTPEMIDMGVSEDIALDVCFRTRQGMGPEVKRRIMQMAEKELYTPDAVIVDVTPITFYRDQIESYGNNTYTKNVLMCIFLLFNIVLGILGTFWHRTLERRSEIAIMRALGASRTRIYMRTVGEGLLLLLAAFGVGVFISYVLVSRGVTWLTFYNGYTVERFVSTQCITLALMALAVEAAVIMPALLAKSTPIASAIREE